MLINFFDSYGIVNEELLPAGKIGSQYIYQEILERR